MVQRMMTIASHHPLNHKLAVIRTLLERCYSIVTEEDDRKKEEKHVAKALSKCGYPPWTINRVKQDIMEKSLKDETKKAKNTRGNHKGMVVVPYVKELSEAFARILKSHGIAIANRPHRTLRSFVVHPKDKVKDGSAAAWRRSTLHQMNQVNSRNGSSMTIAS